MFQSNALHPVFRHGNVLVSLILALGTVVLSAFANPHSVAWLIGVYLSLLFFIEARRRLGTSPLIPSYCLYIFVMNQYLLLVWFLHIWVPGTSPERVKQEVLFWAHALGLGSIFLPVTMYRFTLKFANIKSRILRLIEVLGWIIAIALGVANFTGYFTREYVWSGVVWVPKVEAGYVPYFVYTSVFVMLTCGVPLVKMFMTPKSEHRLQLFYYFAGAVPVYLTCWSHFLISLGINLYPFGGVFFALHVLIIAYAVLFQKVYDIKIVIRRGLAYGAVSMLLGIGYGGLIILSSLIYAERPRPADVVNGVLFVLIGGFFYAPLLNFLQRGLDRLFFRSETNRQDLFEEFTQRSATTIDLPVLSELLCSLLHKTLLPKRIQLFIRDEDGSPQLFGEYHDSFVKLAWPRSAPMPEHLHQAAKGGKTSIQVASDATRGAVSLAGGLDGLLVPIVNRMDVLGYLCLEPKRADDPYSEDDVRFVKTVAAHSSVAIQNARSFTQVLNLQKLTTNVFEGLNVGVLVLDSAGSVIRSNDAAQKILCPGESRFPDQLVDLNPHAPQIVYEMTSVLHDGLPRTNKEIAVNEARLRTILFSSRLIHTEENVGVFLVLLNDITEYREMERLAQRRGELAQVGEMVSGINHEIKNILQPVQYQVKRLTTLGTEDQVFQRAMTVIPDRLKALELLLENLRNLSRPIELRPRTLNVIELTESVLKDVKELPSSLGVCFEVANSDTATKCKADGHWLRHVLYNLVRNAVEATDGQNIRSVRVMTERKDQNFCISVNDSGKGIARKDVDRLFKPFFTTKAEAGTGLGLSVSQKVMELHRGKIEVQSEEGKGATFIIVLPHDPESDCVKDV